MEKAIQKAIEGGYEYKGFDVDGNIQPTANSELVLLDRLFWQCLGKSLGWGKICPHCNSVTHPLCWKHKSTSWQHEWHRFIDHLIEGKDPEEFFNNLLADK